MSKNIAMLYFLIHFLSKTWQYEAYYTFQQKVDLNYSFSFFEDVLLFLNCERPNDSSDPSQKYGIFIFEKSDSRIHFLVHYCREL